MSSLFHMPRVLISPDALRADTITIRDAPTLHHLRHVLRVKVGEPLECFDGFGHRYFGTAARCEREAVIVQVDRGEAESPPPLRITLAQALIRPQRFEWVLEKATELGVSRIVPLTTTRSRVQDASVGRGHRSSRWRRLIEAAAAQCGRATLPTLEDAQSFERFLERVRGCPALLATLVGHPPPLREQIRRVQTLTSVTVFIGPEGDFSEDEVGQAARVGVQPFGLGPRTLRSETAAITALAMLACWFTPPVSEPGSDRSDAP